MPEMVEGTLSETEFWSVYEIPDPPRGPRGAWLWHARVGSRGEGGNAPTEAAAIMAAETAVAKMKAYGRANR